MTIARKAYTDLTAEDFASVKLWGHPTEETLVHADLDEAIEAYLDGGEMLDGTIDMGGFVPMALPQRGVLDPDDMIERIREALDEDYGDPNGPADDWTPSDRIKQAAQALGDAFRADYRVWACEDIIHVEVPVRAWIEKNAPHWLAEAVS